MSKESNTHTDIRRVALNLLTRRDHSQQELIQKLRNKGFVLHDITLVVTDLAQAGLINENRFVENFIYWRRNKGYGPQRIQSELQARGIPAEMIAQHLEITDNAWFVGARSIWQKHFKSKMPSDFKTRAKQMRFLQYRGFTREQIASVFGTNEYET